MAGFVTASAKRNVLDVLVGKSLAWTAPRLTYVGLATALPASNIDPTLANITEISTGGYARSQVNWEPATSTGSLAKIVNDGDVLIGPMTADMPFAYYAFLTNAASGTTGQILYVWELAEPVKALANKPILIPDAGLIIE